MGVPRVYRLRWLLILLGLVGLGGMAHSAGWAEASHIAAFICPGVETATAQDLRERIPDVADPWALSPTGDPLDAGYGPGQERPGLLP